MITEMKVRGLMFDPYNNAYIVILRVEDNADMLPIWVGKSEASAISFALEGVTAPRPMTHDLMKSVLDTVDAKVISVVITDLNDVIDVIQDYRERIVIRKTASYAIGNYGRDPRLDGASCFERERVCGCSFRNNPDNFCIQFHAVADGASRTDARAHPNGNVNHIEIRNRAEQFHPVGGHAFDNVAMVWRHEVQPLILRQGLRMLPGFLKIVAELDEVCTLAAHRGILFYAVAVRHDDCDWDSEALSCERD